MSKKYLKDVSTFQELDEYILVLTKILNLIDKHKDNACFHKYDLHITANFHGKEGFSYVLKQGDVAVACVGYYNLDREDESWINDLGEFVHIYGFPQEGQTEYKYTTTEFTKLGDSVQRHVNVPYNADDYNEEMYTQLEFIHTQMHIKGGMILSQLGKSDPYRKFRQFVIYERAVINFYEVLKDMESLIECKN